MSKTKMTLNMVFVILLMATTLNNGVVGRRLAPLEDPDLDKQLEHLNKPAVMSIRTKYGDLYDCTDFYKQPAFDHPLLKNQASKFQMSSHSDSDSEKGDGWIRELWMNGKGCPYGTVPIKRTTKEDLLGEKLYLENYSSRSNPLDANQPEIHDPLTQNWYLQLGEKGIQVGFWPAKLFTSLQNKATYVNWEGHVSSPPGMPSPPMGSGAALPLKFNFHLYAHMINVSFRNETNDPVNAFNTRPIADATDQYNVFDVGLNYGGNPSIGHSFFYGGPGGIAGN
ncbi:Neprosin activation peptide [Dillenia turbinata]|uniref:Neprosin activation peptide n=1 Tax=Dillenia turbinata TaxID=194707 RepID=A0AAN8W8C0_9MAGN